jgi:hypothetical protein
MPSKKRSDPNAPSSFWNVVAGSPEAFQKYLEENEERPEISWERLPNGQVLSTQPVSVGKVPLRVETSWGAHETGRYEPVSVTVSALSDRPLVGSDLRRVPFGSLQQAARQDAARITSSWSLPYGIARVADQLERIGLPHRGRATSEQELAEVAKVYLEAWGLGAPVTDAVMNYFHISKSAAGKRIMKARAAGLLDSARRIAR